MRRIVVAGVVGVALIAGACSGGSKSSAPKPSTKPTVPRPVGGPTTSSPPTAQSPPDSVDPNAPEVNPAGDIPDNQVFVAYAAVGRVQREGARRLGPQRAGRGGASSPTTSTASVMETVTAASAPTVASAEQGEVPAITAAVKNLASARVTAVTRKAGQAVLITYRADSNPDAVTGKVRRLDVERYEFWRNGTQVILTLSAPQGADNVDPWRIVTDSFGWR